jgi:hypothetical protein
MEDEKRITNCTEREVGDLMKYWVLKQQVMAALN